MRTLRSEVSSRNMRDVDGMVIVEMLRAGSANETSHELTEAFGGKTD